VHFVLLTSEEKPKLPHKKKESGEFDCFPSVRAVSARRLFVRFSSFVFVCVCFFGVAEVEEEERFVFLSFPPFFVSFSRRYLTLVEIKNPPKRRKFRPGRNKKHTHKTPNISDSITTAMS
jgi:hypothetical protein